MQKAQLNLVKKLPSQVAISTLKQMQKTLSGVNIAKNLNLSPNSKPGTGTTDTTHAIESKKMGFKALSTNEIRKFSQTNRLAQQADKKPSL